ncbi:MAG: hypothetical protein J2P21_02905 [Chloracidobacterium sp.]|nr:hypothetical protein [Chloracidobacterium sp.]
MKKTWMMWVMTAVMVSVIVPMTGLANGNDQRRYSINERQRRQELRIGEGIRSGALTRPEVRRLEGQQARIRAQEFRARRSGGVFTPVERARIQREEDFASRNIYLQKHDRQRH